VVLIIETEIICTKKPKLNNPICVVGLPGIGHIGRITVDYMIHQLKAVKFAELYSPFFFPFVIVHDDKIHTLKNEFYYVKGKKQDLVLMIGDCQTYDPKGHYEVAGKVLDFLTSIKCKKLITVGGFSTGEVNKKPKVYGVVTNDKQAKELKKHNIELKVSGKIGTIVGASGLFIGLGKLRGIEGFCILGETSGFPIVTDPKSAESVLSVLQKILKIKINMSKLKEKVEAMHEFIKKLNHVQTQALQQMKKTKNNDEDLKYIG
jgi:uncharacterized protein